MQYFGVFAAASGLLDYIDTIWGFKLDYDYSFIVSPIALLQFSVNENLDNMAAIIIVFIVQIAVTYLAGVIAFKHRKAEVAETTCFR